MLKIKPTTLGLFLVALALGGVVTLVAQQPAPKPVDEKTQTVIEEEKPLFTFKEADVQTLALQTRLHTLKFERDKSSKWQMLTPEKTTASDASLAFLLDLVVSAKSPRSITAPLSDREQFGLHQPTATLDVTLKDKTAHRLVVGEYDFNRTHFYAQVDPAADAQELQVVLVSPNFDNAVNRPLGEWKQSAAEKSGQKASPVPIEAPVSPSPAASPDSPNPESPAPSDSPPPTPESPAAKSEDAPKAPSSSPKAKPDSAYFDR